MQIIKRKVDSNLHLHRLQGGVEALFDHMLCGHALIAYRKQNGEFRLVKATLVHYRGGLPQGIRSRQNRWCRCPLGRRATGLENLPGGEFP